MSTWDLTPYQDLTKHYEQRREGLRPEAERLLNTTEGAAYGAALLAGVGANFFGDVPAACQATIRITGSTQPGPVAPLYREYYPRYQALYSALSEEFKRMAEVVNRQLAGGMAG